MYSFKEFYFKYVKDLAVRSLSLLVTTAIILFDSEDRAKDYIIIISTFNISIIFFNFGGQFYASRSSSFLRKLNLIHSFFFILSFSMYFVASDLQNALSAICLGICYAKVNEFNLRRNNRYLEIFLFSLMINIPRVFSFFYDIDYCSSTLVTSLLFFIYFIIKYRKNSIYEMDIAILPNSEDAGKINKIFNYAFFTSIVYVIYQQLPSMVAVADLSNTGRYEQVLSRVIFAFLFVKSSFVMTLIRSKRTIKLNWNFLFSLYSLVFVTLLFLDVYSIISYFIFSLLSTIVFISSEFIFSFVSAKRHREYSYKDFFLDNMILLSSSIICVFFDTRLIVTYMISSVTLLLVRSRYEFNKEV